MNPKLMRVGEPGDELVYPNGLRLAFVMTPSQSEGRRLEMDWFVPPGERLVAADHYHPDGPEVWRVIEGEAGYRFDGEERFGIAPHEYEVPAFTSHGHPWNKGDGVLNVRQIIASPEPIPELAGGVQGFFETLAAFAQEGRLTPKGEIDGRVQNLHTIHDLLVPGTFLAGPPRFAQRLTLGGLSAAARLAGRCAYRRPEFSNGRIASR
jgi:hypothetical protein